MSGEMPHCRYELIENGIHRFTIEQASLQSVNEFLDHVGTIYENTPPGQVNRLLVDLRPDGLPPINNTVRVGRRFNKENPNQPPSRVAYVYSDSALMSLAQTFLEILRFRNVTRKFFRNDESAAIAWLMAD